MEDQQTEEFIRVVRSHEMLWNLAHPLYKNIKQKSIKWRKIGKEFGLSYDAVRIKWKNLRDTYARNLKRRVSRQAEEDPTFFWKHTKQMEFLKEQLKPKKRIKKNSSIAEEGEEEASTCMPPDSKCSTDSQITSSPLCVVPKPESLYFDPLTHDVESSDEDDAAPRTNASQPSCRSDSVASTSSLVSKRKPSTMEHSLIGTMQILQEYLKKPRKAIVSSLPSNSAATVEDELFFRSMLMKLSTFPIELRNEAKIEMMRYLSSLQSELLRSSEEQK